MLHCGSQEDFSEEEEGSGLFGGYGCAGRASLQAGLLCKLAAERCGALAWDDALKSCAAFVDKHEDIRFQLHIL